MCRERLVITIFGQLDCVSCRGRWMFDQPQEQSSRISCLLNWQKLPVGHNQCQGQKVTICVAGTNCLSFVCQESKVTSHPLHVLIVGGSSVGQRRRREKASTALSHLVGRTDLPLLSNYQNQNSSSIQLGIVCIMAVLYSVTRGLILEPGS